VDAPEFKELRYLEAGDKTALLDAVAGATGGRPSPRILEIGCGSGGVLLALAGRIPEAALLGVDISAANIAEAERRARENGHAERARFQLADYLATPLGPCDVIYADSVLHLLGSPASPLLRKLSGDLAPGGSLVCTLPDARLFNRVLWLLRRVFRLLRCKALDAFFLFLAKSLHAGTYSEAQLRDRIPYMYILPAFRLDAALRRQIAAAGLEIVAETLLPHVSPGQPGHRLLVCRKPS